MKKTRFLPWAAALLLAMFTVTACSDSDDDDKKGTTDSRLETEGNKTFVPDSLLTDEEKYLIDCQFSVVRVMEVLAGVDEVTPDVVNQSYEPVYGQVLSNGSSLVRSVKCESVADAEELFRSLAGVDDETSSRLLTVTPDGYEVSLKDLPILPDGSLFTLGTLTFHRDGSGSRQGYIDVDIRCIPHLERIDFIPASAFPDNASGNTAYVLGDVVYLPEGNPKDYCPGYYLCVKQYDGADGWLVHMCINEPGGKETKNLDGDGAGCYYPYNRDKGMNTVYDMIKAYCYFIIDNQAKVENIKAFLNDDLASKRPSHTGKMDNIFPQGFNNSNGKPFVSSDGRSAAVWYEAHYEEYAWVPAYNYRRGYYAWVRNNSETVTSESYKYVKDSKWNDQWNGKWNYCMNAIRFDRNTISGSTLEFSPTNTQDIVHKNDAVNVSSRHLGWCYADNNRLYETPQEAVGAGHTPLGVVVYVNDGSEFGNQVTEYDNGAGHALVMSYTAEYNTGGGARTVLWNSGSSGIVTVDPDDAFTKFVNKSTGAQGALTDFKGYEKTLYLEAMGSPAARYCRNHQPATPSLSTTGWFIPSTAQWLAIMCKPGLGGAPMPSTTDGFPTYPEGGSSSAFSNINQYISKAPSYFGFNASRHCWSSSAYSASIGVYLTGDTYGTRLTYYNSGQYAYVRPVFAF